jgi:hypothetical protein
MIKHSTAAVRQALAQIFRIDSALRLNIKVKITQPPSYQTGIPHYGFQTGVGMPQQPNDIQQQNLYRSPQNPMI